MRRFRLRRAARWVLAIITAASLAALADAWPALGARAAGARRERMARSPQWRPAWRSQPWLGGDFVNPQPLQNQLWGSLAAMLRPSPDASPTAPGAIARPAAMATMALPVAMATPALGAVETMAPPGAMTASDKNPTRALATPPPTGLRVTWLGHSTSLIEIDGLRVLTDPIFSDRASPLTWAGPRRWYPPPIALADLPRVDAVVISHDHYDHLDHRTIVAMKDWPTVFVVPLGVGAHLAAWGVPEARIIELDWWERANPGGLEIVCTPSRHASGRTGFDKDATLWAGYALVGPRHRVFYSGDTGMFAAMREIGARLGPFDLTLIEVGQYNQAWPDWHIGPEQAVRAHALLGGRVLLPVHWGLFALAAHAWTEPVERVLAAARAENQKVMVPRPGESVEPEAAPALERWWPEVPWRTASEDPIVSTQLDGI